jgi:hypothetical protein
LGLEKSKKAKKQKKNAFLSESLPRSQLPIERLFFQNVETKKIVKRKKKVEKVLHEILYWRSASSGLYFCSPLKTF